MIIWEKAIARVYNRYGKFMNEEFEVYDLSCTNLDKIEFDYLQRDLRVKYEFIEKKNKKGKKS